MKTLSIIHKSPSKPLTRMARFTVARSYLEEWERLMVPLFENVVVVDARMRWDLDAIEYLAVSNRFPETDPNCVAPTWRVEPEFIDTGTSSGIMRLHLVGPDRHETEF